MTVAPAAERFNRSKWASAFRNVEQELTDVALQPSRGSVPPELLGTLYRNGPGVLERGGQRVHHPFDGDGMITAIQFSAEGVSLTNRFVRTAGWKAEGPPARCCIEAFSAVRSLAARWPMHSTCV